MGDEVFTFDIAENPRHDIVDSNIVRSVLEEFEPDVIYHTAAQSFLDVGEEKPGKDININLGGMLNLLYAVQTLDIDPILVFTSSGAVYGLGPLPHEESQACNPLCNYGVTKLAAEKYLKKWAVTQGVKGRIVRFSSVYGHGRPAGPVNIFINQADQGGPLTVYGTGSQTRDMISIEDVCPGLIKVAERGRRGEVYNIGGEKQMTVAELADLLGDLTPLKLAVEHRPHFTEDHAGRLPLLTKVQGLGWRQRVDVTDGLRRMLPDYGIPLKRDVDTEGASTAESATAS